MDVLKRDYGEDSSALTDLCVSILKQLEASFPQTKINGDNNIWIFKPAG